MACQHLGGSAAPRGRRFSVGVVAGGRSGRVGPPGPDRWDRLDRRRRASATLRRPTGTVPGMTEEEFGGDVGAVADDTPDGDAVAELQADASGESEAGVTTGVQVVDDVLGTLEGLADQPV